MNSRSTVKSNSRQRTLEHPTNHIGCQALLNVSECSHSGFLAKRGRRERLIERFNFPKKTFFKDLKKWRKRFVVISQGCVYIYDKNSSNDVHQSFSLHNYKKLVLFRSENDDFPFRLVGREHTMKEYQFSCSTDNERREWMQMLRDEMCVANGVTSESNDDDDDDDEDYNYLQTPIFEDDTPANSDDEDDDGGSDASDYTEIPDKAVIPRSKMALPPTPVDLRENSIKSTDKARQPLPQQGKNKTVPQPPRLKTKKVTPPPPIDEEDSDTSETSTKPLPKTPAKPPPKTAAKPPPTTPAKPKSALKPPTVKQNKKSGERKLSEEEYLYAGNDREKVAEILEKGPTGTFLVRNSRTDASKVLAVNTDEAVKEYKVYKRGKDVTIDRQVFYGSMQDLIEAYTTSNLPKRTITLGHAYSNLDLTA